MNAISHYKPLPRSFYARDTHRVARDLLGRLLVRKIGRRVVSGHICEVECYVGFDDKASHAARGQTPRNQVMFGQPGLAYVYLIYGMYNCLNVVTEKKDFPAAVLIRSLVPADGIADMQRRRATPVNNQLTSGPGKLCIALDIDRRLNGHDLTSGNELFIADHPPKEAAIIQATRIGVDYAGESAQLPWRYLLKMSS